MQQLALQEHTILPSQPQERRSWRRRGGEQEGGVLWALKQGLDGGQRRRKLFEGEPRKTRAIHAEDGAVGL